MVPRRDCRHFIGFKLFFSSNKKQRNKAKGGILSEPLQVYKEKKVSRSGLWSAPVLGRSPLKHIQSSQTSTLQLGNTCSRRLVSEAKKKGCIRRAAHL